MSRIGKRWVKAEEEQLLEEINTTKDFAAIAALHGRSEIAIRARLTQIAIDMMNKDSTLTVSDIAPKFGLLEMEITQFQNRKQTPTQSLQPPVVKWTAAEDQQLVEDIKTVQDIKKLSVQYKKSEWAIINRLKYLSLSKVDKDKCTLEQAVNTMGLTMDFLMNYKPAPALKNNNNNDYSVKELSAHLNPHSELNTNLLVEIRDLLKELTQSLKQ
jgi:hypothetical protein